ncbi:MAG: serine hydrolase domain-containing protein, partial [Bacteroidota bacterium]
AILSCSKKVAVKASDTTPGDQLNWVDTEVGPYIERAKNRAISLALIHGDEIEYYHYGEADRETAEVPDNDHFWEIGSISKTYTAALVVAYFEAKDLNLESLVSSFLPEDFSAFHGLCAGMQVQHLLNHTSGLPRLPDDIFEEADMMDPYVHYDRDQILAFLKDYEPQSAPGEVHEYSNLGFALLGILLERHSGRSYADLLQAYVLAPMSLSNTQASTSNDLRKRMVKPYLANGVLAEYWQMGAWIPTGGIVANLPDLAKYAQAQLPGRGAALAHIFEQCKVPTFTESESMRIGLSWFTLTFSGQEWYFHNGGTGGFQTLLLADPQADKAMVLLSNNGFQDESEVLGFQIFEQFVAQ